jgi:YaiO family outer membrane protein
MIAARSRVQLPQNALVLLALAIAPCAWMAAASAQCAPRPASLEAAVRLAKSHRLKAAELTLDCRLKAFPKDTAAKVWLARLQSWEHRYASAEFNYRSVLRTEPDNEEAALGLAQVQMWRGDYSGADQTLDKILSVDPRNTDALTDKARLALWQDDPDSAETLASLGLAVSPGDASLRRLAASAMSRTATELSAGYMIEGFNFAPSAPALFLQVIGHPDSRLAIAGRYEHVSKFDESDNRLVGEMYADLGSGLALHFAAGFANRSATVLPLQDLGADVTRSIGNADFGAGMRVLNFHAAHIDIPEVFADWNPGGSILWSVHVTPARTRFFSGAQPAWATGGLLKATWLLEGPIRPYVALGLDNEDVLAPSVDRIGNFSGQAIASGAEVLLGPTFGFRMDGFYEIRPQRQYDRSFALSFFYRLPH